MSGEENPFVRLFRAEEAAKKAPVRDTVSSTVKAPIAEAIEAPAPLPTIATVGPDRVRGAPPPNGTIDAPTAEDDMAFRRSQLFAKDRRLGQIFNLDNGGYVNSGGAPELTPGMPQAPDTWGDVGSKLLHRLLPQAQQALGGAMDALTEKGPSIAVGALDSSVGKGVLGAALGTDVGGQATPGGILDSWEKYQAAERDAGRTPGARLYNSAEADLRANAYSTGNTGLKRFAPMAAESAVQMVPAIAATLATKSPGVGMAIMGGQVFGQQYGDSRAQGRTPDQALTDAAFNAAAEVIGEEIPLGMMMKPGGKFLPRTLKQMGAEGVQEMFTQVLQTGYDKGILNPDMTWKEAFGQIRDAGLVGAVLGGQMSLMERGAHALIRPKGEASTDAPTRPPAPPGIVELASDPAALVTPEDEASPIPTEMIAAGKAVVARATATGAADKVLEGAGVPKTGTRVSVNVGGKVHTGTVSDAFEIDAGAAGTAPGVKITLDDGSTIEEPVSVLNDMGVNLRPTSDDPALAAMQDLGRAGDDTASAAPVRTKFDYSPPVAQPTAQPNRPPSAISGFMAKVGRAESPSDTAKNPNSSAKGRYQFTDGTWLGTYRQVYGNTGETDAQILSKKTDGATQDRLMQELTARNDATLKRAGVERTDGNRYLAHFAGASKAAEIAKADPSTPIENILGADAIKANPFLKGKTAGQVVAWAAARMGEPATFSLGAIDPAEEAIQFSDIFADDEAAPDTSSEKQSTLSADRVDSPPASDTGLAEVGSGAAKAIGGNMRDMLLAKLDKGDLTENGDTSAVLQVMDQIRRSGGTVDKSTLLDITTGYAKADALTGADRQSALRDLVQKFSPAAADTGSATEPHPGLVIKSLQTGKETTVQPVGTHQGEAPAAPASKARVEEMPSGKSVAIHGATKEQLAAVVRAIPNAKPLLNARTGATVYSKKYQDKINAALKPSPAAPSVAGEPIDGEWTKFAPDSGTLNVPRADMPQIKAEHRGAMVNFLNARGVAHEEETIPAADLKPTQAEFSPAKVEKAKRFEGGDRAILVSSDGHVLDGHHQWMAKRDVGEDVRAIRLKSPIRDLLPTVHEFPSATTDDKSISATADAPAKTDAPTPSASVSPFRAGEDSAGGESSVPPSPAASSYGHANKVFTNDAAEKARALLRSKLTQLNSGFDPDAAQAGLTLIGYHIEAGARAFIDAARAVAADLGVTPADLKTSLRSWYMSARLWMEDHGHDVRGMDDADTVAVDLRRIDQWGGSVTAAPEPAIQPPDGLQRAIPPGDARPVADDVQPPVTDGSVGQLRTEEVGGSAPAVRPVDSGSAEDTDRSGDRPADRPERTGASARDDAGLPDRSEGGRRAGVTASGLAAGNFHIAPGALDEARGPKAKARDNLTAIEIVKALERENRPATADEQRQIAQYVGWGGLKNVFPDGDGVFGKGFEDIGARLRDLLTPEEYDTARRSIQYAHYTAEAIVREMWRGAEALGFKGGSVFEPGMGTGNFLGMMPPALAARSQYSGIEMDGITAAIAKALYPQSGVTQADYTAYDAPKNAFDLVIGNPPFSETIIKADPEYKANGFVLHDYFFAKSLDSVRPGGLLMFVTSAGTMNKLDSAAREYLADRAELVGAIRLPNDAFAENAGTSVTTDIVVLRKRLASETAGDQAWTETVSKSLPMHDGSAKEGPVSRYFADHPEMVLGNEEFSGFPARYAVVSSEGPLAAKLADAVDRLGANAMQAGAATQAPSGMDFGSTEKKNGSFYIGADGALYQQQGSVGRPVGTRAKGEKGGVAAADQEKVRQLIPIRDALRDVYQHDLAARPAEAEKARANLNKLYDSFVAKHGPINKGVFTRRRPSRVQIESARRKAREEARARGFEWEDGTFDVESLLESGATLAQIAAARDDARTAYERAGKKWDEGTFDPKEVPDTILEKRPNIDAFMDDPESYRLRSIEHYNDATGAASKGPVFTQNLVSREGEPQIKNATDALYHSLNSLGRVDIEAIAKLTGISPSDAIDQLAGQIFRTPDGTWESAPQYLSGNIRKKLAAAENAAANDPSMRGNVDALRAVLPADLGKADVRATLGMNWIDTSDIVAFGQHLGLDMLHVSYQPILAQWIATGDRASAASVSTWGTSRRSASELISDALNGKSPKIYDSFRDANGNSQSVLNQEETQAATDKLVALKEQFKEWVWSDPARTERLLRVYNDTFNSLVAPEYDGAHLTTPGISALWSWRPHQTRVIARIIQEGNTYMAHAVGAGKTSAMIGAGMEMKRLGLVNKPMYVVPNHMLQQFTKEFYEQYPTARIMVADDDRNFVTDKRKQFISDMATADLDAVIIKHSAFGLIPLSETFQRRMINEQLDELRDILNVVKQDKSGDPAARVTRRKIEQMVEQAEQRLRAVMGGKKDQTFTFEETGIDFLFVDEAHLFRKLDFPTNRGDVKGIDPSGSMRSLDLFMKTRLLEERRPRRSHVLASGTPITNTMAELYTISRYLQPDELKERGIDRFDAWASAFGDTVTDLEPTAAGTYKPVTRFSQFVNVPELSAMVRQIMDVVTPEQLEQYVTRPSVTNHMVVVPQTSGQAAYQADLAARMKAIENRQGAPKKGDDIMLTVINDGRNSAIDMRLVDPGHDEERTKLMAAIDNIYDTWKATANHPFYKVTADGYSAEPAFHGPATQMLFASRGVGAGRAFNVHRFVVEELARRGVPRSDMVIFNTLKNDVAKQRVFNDMNAGKVRILLGSVEKMGTGVNAQRLLAANHNMDPEWLPSSDEQRNGRIIRQGNLNKSVDIYNYSTKGTYDSAMWGMMARKAKFIEGFFRGDPTLRDMEDLGEASKYEQAKALTTKDPRILELTEAKQELERELRRRSAHSSEIANAVREAASNRRWAERLKETLVHEKADAAARQDIGGDAFKATLDGKSFDERPAFQEALDKALAGQPDREGISAPLGQLGGFPLAVLVEENTRFVQVDGTTTKETKFHKAPVLMLNGDNVKTGERRYKELSATSTAVSAQAFLSKLDTQVEGTEREIARHERAAADFEARSADAGPYRGEAKIAELEGRVDGITKELEAEGKAAAEAAKAVNAPTASPKESRTAADPVIRLTGEEMGKMPGQGVSRMSIMRDRALRFYAQMLSGKTVTGTDGVPVQFTRIGQRKTTHNKGEDLLRALPAVQAIIEKGTIKLMPQKSGSQMTAYLYSAPVELDGRVLDLAVIAREDSEGRRYYTLTWDKEGGAGSPGEPGGDRSKASIDPTMEGTAGTELNLFLADEQFNDTAADDQAEAGEEWGRIADQLNDRLRALGIGDRIVAEVTGKLRGDARVAGEYFYPVVRVAIESRQGTGFTVNHEAIHALRDLGLFLAPEWRTLEMAARADKAMMDSVARRYPDLNEEGQIEEAIADRFARWSSGDTDIRGFAARVFDRIRNFLTALGEAMRGNGFRTADSVMAAVDRGEVGGRESSWARPLADVAYSRDEMADLPDGPRYSVAPTADTHTFDNSETEERFQKATEGLGSGDNLVLRLKTGLGEIANGFARHWQTLPNVPKYAELQQKLRSLEAAPSSARDQAVRLLSDLVKGFSRADLDLFTRKAILDDLIWEADQEHELPFGLTPDTLRAEKDKVDALVQGQEDKRVWKATMQRKVINRKIAADLVAAGVLDAERVKNPAYFRHQVLDYARTQARLASTGSKLKSPKWAKRMGSSLDINANLLEAEFDWLAKALTDIPVAKSIEWIKQSEHNILGDLQQQARDSNAQGIAEIIAKEKDRDGAVTAAERDFRTRIARGFAFIKDRIEDGTLDHMPRQFERAADAIVSGARGETPYPFLAWLLDNNEVGAMGAAMILKAIGERRTWTERVLGKAYIDPTDSEGLVKRLAPDGYTTWSPDEGKLLFTVKTLPEHVIDGMIGKIDSVPGLDASEFRAQLEKARSALAMGGDRYKMVVPQEVADTLNRLRREDVEGILGEVLAIPVRAWKRWVLINPRRVIKYNLNNMSGDLDAVIAGNPKLLRRSVEAAREVAAVMRGTAQPSARYQEAVDRGVFDSGLSIQEIPDINRLSAFKHLTNETSKRPDKLAVAAIGKVWRGLNGFTHWRENVFRYAAYLDYADRLDAGETMAKIGYGASVPAMVDQITDTKDKAALLARDLMGDYGAVSENGQWMRAHLVPFWSWMEINTKRYWRLTSNAYTQGAGKGIATGSLLAGAAGVRTTAWLAFRMMALYGLINVWNWMLFGDDEKDLDEQQRQQLHIILGRNAAGEVVTLRTQGAFSDAMGWFGIGDAASAIRAYQEGRGDIGSILAAPFKASINRVGTSFSPAVTLPIESATGKKLWPDLFATRVNRDPWRNLFQTFSLENEYDLATSQPSRGYGRSFIDGVVYRRQPGEIAYDESRGLAYQWLQRTKGQEGSSSFSTPRSEATRRYKTALRYDDTAAAEKALAEMSDLGMTAKDLAGSIKRASPLGPIPKKDRKAFLDQLTDEEFAKFQRAQSWYDATFK